MNKAEFVARVSSLLREKDIRKPIPAKKSVFHITSDEGEVADFTLRQKDRGMLFTNSDVSYIVEACLAVLEDALKHGENITFHGFGTIGLHYRAPRRTKQPGTDTWCEVEGRYVPKMDFGNVLRMAARVYEAQQEDAASAPKLPDPVYDEYD